MTTKRFAEIQRSTAETTIQLALTVDGSSQVSVQTGYGFADHMLTLLAFWAGFDLTLQCKGDLQVDAHHTVEDVAICLGNALRESLTKGGAIARVGNARVPMDEALASVDTDLSGRSYLVYNDNNLLPPVIAGEEADLWREFFKAFAHAAHINLHITFHYGKNGHHLLESAFKGTGLALRQAVKEERHTVLSTKGSLDS